MDNLHKSRINVLREKQGKQLERISAKQESELEALSNDHRQQLVELESAYQAEEDELGRDFGARKQRLMKRWALAEAIERRKLEVETGDSHGALPPVAWEERDPGGEEEQADGVFAKDVGIAYDAKSMNLI